jgi:excisionase family DNA binding protein
MSARRELSARFLTSSDVAELLGVGVSSVKRWTDEGVLGSVRTVGGHRRYLPAEVSRFAGQRGIEVALPVDSAPALSEYDEVHAREALLHALIRGAEEEAQSIVAAHFATDLDRASFLDRVVGGAMKLIGDRWEEGILSVDCEHRSAHIVAQILDQHRPRSRGSVSRATLASPPGELHDLPLRMVRLVLELEGWRTDFLGANTPWDSMTNALREQKSNLLLLSSHTGEVFGTPEFADFAVAMTRRGIRIGIGGAWARGGRERRTDQILRFRSLGGFQRWLRSELEARRAS